MALAGFEGAQGGNKGRGFDCNELQDVKLLKDAKIVKLREDPEERKDSKNIENNQIFSNIAYPNPKKNSQKTFEFFQNLKSSNLMKKSHMQT